MHLLKHNYKNICSNLWTCFRDCIDLAEGYCELVLKGAGGLLNNHNRMYRKLFADYRRALYGIKGPVLLRKVVA